MRVLVMTALFATAAAAGDIVWRTDLEKAFDEAKKSRRMILVNVRDSV